MKFRAHDTFFIRKGWLYKGLKNIKKDPYVFVSDTNNPMDVLGIGANMVKALRFWMKAVGLTEENKSGKRYQKFTDFGNTIYNNDKYIEEMGTLWLLHYKLAISKDEASAWHFFYNDFRLSEFTKDDFVIQLANYLRIQNMEVSERSLEDDFNCIINTYLPRVKSNPTKVSPESNIECPLSELGLIDIMNKKSKVYKKCIPKKENLHPLIFLAVLLDQAKGSQEIKISTLQTQENNVGKVFNLDIISLIALLTKVEHLCYVKVIRTAGLDIVKMTTDMNFIDCINEYYKSINK